MSISVLKIAIPLSTPATAFLSTEVSLPQGELTEVRYVVDTVTPGLVAFRLWTQNQQLAPSPGFGLDNWLPAFQSGYMGFPLARRLDGPPYRVQVDYYNADTAIRNLFIMFIFGAVASPAPVLAPFPGTILAPGK
jgi:hypothetical protein